MSHASSGKVQEANSFSKLLVKAVTATVVVTAAAAETSMGLMLHSVELRLSSVFASVYTIHQSASSKYLVARSLRSYQGPVARLAKAGLEAGAAVVGDLPLLTREVA